MNERDRRERVRLNRRMGLALAVAGFGSLLFMAGALAGSVAMVNGDPGKGEFYLSAAPIGAAATGIGSLYLFDQLGRLGPRFARRSWLGLPRYVWLIGCVGLAFALTNLLLAAAAFTGVAHR
ncbi:MAG: hypothetical protein E6I36_11260 [Chloroflexi bacterium]|nr:MAG: hypothetical protein E6I36_11260 [Chloroflexota bacterium]